MNGMIDIILKALAAEAEKQGADIHGNIAYFEPGDIQVASFDLEALARAAAEAWRDLPDNVVDYLHDQLDELEFATPAAGETPKLREAINRTIDAALADVIVPKPEVVPVEVKPVSVHFPGDPNFIMSETVSKVEVWGSGDYTVHFVEPTKAGETYTFGLRLPD